MDVEAVRARFPIFERLTYINSCSQGALSDSVRQAYDSYLRDWDEKGAPWEYWVERTEAARAAFAGLINAEPDEIAVTTSVSAGVAVARERAPLREPVEGRPHRARVPDDRPDLARAGGARGPDRPRGAGRLRDGDRRGHAARLDHARLVPHRRNGGRAGRGRSSARAGRARAARRLPDGRLAAGRRQGARRRLPRRRRPQVPARLRRPCVLLLPARAVGEGVADGDGLVRGRGHLQDGHPRLLAVADRAALPIRDAAGARRSTPASRASS